MAYAMMRVNKLKSTGSIGSCDRHNDRKRDTPNADKSKFYLNKIVVGSENKTYLNYFNEKTKDIKIRKNAVYAVEVFLSASKNSDLWKSSQLTREWVNDSIKWLNQVFTKENVCKVHFHLDETSPHLHAFIVPMYNNKLNCKYFLGGTKYRLSEYQTSYHKMVEKYGLERGVKGSQAKHQDVKKYYNALNEELSRELPKPRMFESKEKFKLKVDKEYQKVVLKNLNQSYEIQKLQSQLYLKKKYKKIDKKKSFIDRELEKYNRDKKINNLDLKIEKTKKEIENKKILNFLEKNPDLKQQLQQLMIKNLNRSKNREKER